MEKPDRQYPGIDRRQPDPGCGRYGPFDDSRYLRPAGRDLDGTGSAHRWGDE